MKKICVVLILCLSASILYAQTKCNINRAWAYYTISFPGMQMMDENGNPIPPKPAIERMIYIEWCGTKKPEIKEVLYNNRSFAVVLEKVEGRWVIPGKNFSTENTTRITATNCKKLWKLKGKRLGILFHSAVNVGLRKAAMHTYRLPNHNEKTVNERKVSSQTRKSPYQFGWDTHPRLVTCGVWLPIVLTGWSDAKMVDNFLDPLKTEAIQAEYTVHTTITASKYQGYQLSVSLTNSTNPASQKNTFL